MRKVLYLAAPYSHPDQKICAERAAATAFAASVLMTRYDFVVFAPTVQGHLIIDHLPLEQSISHDFWMGQCLPMLQGANTLGVLKLPGWKGSLGVKHEWDFAVRNHIPIREIEFFSHDVEHQQSIAAASGKFILPRPPFPLTDLTTRSTT